MGFRLDQMEGIITYFESSRIDLKEFQPKKERPAE
jgi:hypothetical protein